MSVLSIVFLFHWIQFDSMFVLNVSIFVRIFFDKWKKKSAGKN